MIKEKHKTECTKQYKQKHLPISTNGKTAHKLK